MKARNIAITGATGGIGTALVGLWASPDVTFFLAGRNTERLKEVRELAQGRGAVVHTCKIDVTEVAAFAEALLAFDAVHPVDLFICGAGVKTGQTAGCEPPVQLDRVLDVNLRAPLHAVQSILPKMIARRQGQIALFSSIAAISPHADLLSYSATKAAIRAYGTGLRQAVRGTGVSVSIITPGFVDTPMTDRQLGPTPQKISAERAAMIIDKGLARNRPYITFPLTLTGLVRLKAILPVGLRDLIDSWHRASIVPDDDEAESK
jgi:NADP-dependent 3-hydroxy acid dehydrogenase YdfG